VDGAVRAEEDREVLLPHALLRPGQQAARLLQEEAQGQYGTPPQSILLLGRFNFVAHLLEETCVPLYQNLAAALLYVLVAFINRGTRSGCLGNPYI
jgi:hypothetical protein